MPFLLYTYLITEILAPFFASLIILNAILFLGRLVPLLDTIFNFGIGMADFLRLCGFMAPNLLRFSIPMASMMGVIIAFTRMTNDNEIMALKASGIGLYRLLPPVLLVALLTSAATALTATTLIPRGTVAMKHLLFDLAKKKIDQGIPARQFSEGIKNVVIYVDQIDPDSGRWQGVYVSDLRDRKAPVTIVAKAGRLSARTDQMLISMELSNGSMHRAVDDLTQTIHFQRYTLNLPFTPPTTIDGESVTQVGSSGMTLSQLRQRAASLPTGNQERYGLLIEFHQRLALPVGCFILTVLGLPLTLLGRPSHRSFGVPLGLLCFILYYVLLTAAKAFSEEGSLMVGPAMWLPNLGFAVATVLITHRVAQETQSQWLERILGLGERLGRFRSRRGDDR